MCRNPDIFELCFFSGNQVRIFSFFIHPSSSFLVAEVVEAVEFLTVFFTHDTKNRGIMNVVSIYVGGSIENCFVLTNLLQLRQRLEDLSLDSIRILAVFCQIPPERTAVNIAAVYAFIRIFLISIIIDLSDFISAVQHWDTGLGEHIGMKHQVHADSFFHFLSILFKSGAFYSAHGSCCSAESCILCDRIIVVEFSAARTSLEFTCEIIIQEPFVFHFFHSP